MGGGPTLAGVQFAESVIDLIGNTPLVRLSRVVPDRAAAEGPTVLAKIEYVNPGGR